MNFKTIYSKFISARICKSASTISTVLVSEPSPKTIPFRVQDFKDSKASMISSARWNRCSLIVCFPPPKMRPASVDMAGIVASSRAISASEGIFLASSYCSQYSCMPTRWRETGRTS